MAAFPATAQVRAFDLPAQDAITGIPAFARQAGLQIFVSADAVRGWRTGRVRGALPVRAALEQLLAGTGLQVLSNDGRTIVLVRPPPPAPETPAPELRVAEVIVTALKREQRLQEVPAAISVLDPSALAAKNAENFRDYLTTIPGVNYAESGTGAMRVTIRGVSDGIGGTDPTTGIYIDEAPVTESFYATFDPTIFDVERVEILKGPQGTLYGAGSMGGTVRVIGKKPKLDAYEASLAGTMDGVAHGGVGGRVDGVVNLPLVTDKVALRISAGYRNDDGWIDDVRRGDKNGNTVEQKNVRAQLLVRPEPDTQVTLGFMYQKTDNGLPWFSDLALPGYETARVFRQSSSADNKLFSLTIQHDWDWGELVSATNYLKKTSVVATDNTASLRPLVGRLAHVTLGANEGVGVDSGDNLDLVTQEVRLASKGKNRLDWVVGAFFSHADDKTPTVFDFSQAPSTSGVTTGAAFYSANQTYETRQLAGFGELTLNVTDKLSATAGLRVFKVKQHNSLVGSGLLNGGSTASTQDASVSSTTQKYLIKYQATHDNLVYAQAAQGYRNGGPTGAVPPACDSYLATLGYSSVPTSYRPDKLWSYELGTKNTLLDERMQLNGSAYYIDWSDIQSSVSLGCGFGFIANAGKAVSKGAELETVVNPVEGLSLAASAAYVDAHLTQAAPGSTGKADDTLPLTSQWSWNASAQYERPLNDALTGFVRGEVNYVGKRWNLFASAPRSALMPAYTTLGLRLGVRTDRWTVALFGTNLTDQRIVNYINLAGAPYEIVGKPRVIGVDARVDF